MNKWIFSFLFFCASFAWSITAEEIGASLQKQLVINGAFRQARYLHGLDRPLKSEGRFVIARGTGLWWHLQRPFASLLKVTPEGIYTFDDGKWKKDGQSRLSGPQIKLFLALLGGEWQQLQNRFALSAEGSEKDWQIRLIPKTAVMKKLFDDIQIRGGAEIEWIQIQEAQGDRTVLSFREIHSGWPADQWVRAAF